jgi:hypothetical protein
MSIVKEDDIVNTKIVWSNSIELMLAKWCDQAKAFEWMHTEAYSYFEKNARIITIVSNVLTAVSGLTNVISGGITINGFQLAWAFGSLSIIVSITNMLQEKMAYNTRSTEHRQYSILWGTIRRKIEEEISIPPESRKECKTFMKYLRQDINQVSVDGNAKIPEFIRNNCYDKFSKIPNFVLPEICGEMEHTQVYNRKSDTNEITIPIDSQSTDLSCSLINPSINDKI